MMIEARMEKIKEYTESSEMRRVSTENILYMHNFTYQS